MAGTSITVIDADTGKLLASHNPDLGANPASCMKILTSAAALSALGPDYRFKTDVFADRHPRDGTVGTLYIAGTGDPMLVSERIWLIARILYDLGLRRVTDGIVIDETFFDSHDFPRKDGNDGRAYTAKTSAVAVNFNSASIYLAPGASHGAPGIASSEPPIDYFRVVNRLTTGGKYTAGISIGPANGNGYETITVTGQIPAGAVPQLVHRSIDNPTLYAGATFRYVLEQNGIAVSGPVRSGSVPAGAAGLYSAESLPLSQIISSMNKFSNNFIAEQILKHLGGVRFGRPGSTAKGVKAIEAYLQSIGILPGTYFVENGSGLSEATRISAAQLAHVLSAVHRDFSIKSEFVASLPIVGVDGTTKRWRFADSVRGLARAKTGSINGVSSLAGYVPMRDGRTAAFAILVNGLPKGLDAAHRAELEIVKSIAEATP